MKRGFQKGKRKTSDETVSQRKERLGNVIEQESLKIWHEAETLNQFLLFSSRFRQYSYSNQLLIYARFPGATKVMGLKAWNKQKRHVKAGEKGIEIFACIEKTKWVEEEKRDSNNKPVLGSDGKVKKEKKSVKYNDYVVKYVFDIAQTDGEPVPELYNQSEDPLYETEEDLFDALHSLYSVKRMTSEQMLIETAACQLRKSGAVVSETEIYATAYLLSTYLQLDTDFDTNKLCLWSMDKNSKEIGQFMKTINEAANKIVMSLEEQEAA